MVSANWYLLDQHIFHAGDYTRMGATAVINPLRMLVPEDRIFTKAEPLVPATVTFRCVVAGRAYRSLWYTPSPRPASSSGARRTDTHAQITEAKRRIQHAIIQTYT